MKRYISLILMLFIMVLFSGCAQKGTFMDKASIKQAERAIKKTRNSLEEYYVEKGHYPAPSADLGKELESYFTKTLRIPDENNPDKYTEKQVNEWETTIKEAFLDGIVHYETPDTMTTYFIWARANDVNNTIICSRPVKVKTEEATKKKKRK